MESSPGAPRADFVAISGKGHDAAGAAWKRPQLAAGSFGGASVMVGVF
jgi:hypothetical protein